MKLSALLLAGIAVVALSGCERSKAAKTDAKQEPATKAVENSIAVGTYQTSSPTPPAASPVKSKTKSGSGSGNEVSPTQQ